MGWELRSGRSVPHYYRKVRDRETGRVRSLYCGSGERGETAAREDEERRERERAQRRAARRRPARAPKLPAAAPSPPPPAPVPISRAEVLERAAAARGPSSASDQSSRRWAVLRYLQGGQVEWALRMAKIGDEEVARRGLGADVRRRASVQPLSFPTATRKRR